MRRYKLTPKIEYLNNISKRVKAKDFFSNKRPMIKIKKRTLRVEKADPIKNEKAAPCVTAYSMRAPISKDRRTCITMYGFTILFLISECSFH